MQQFQKNTNVIRIWLSFGVQKHKTKMQNLKYFWRRAQRPFYGLLLYTAGLSTQPYWVYFFYWGCCDLYNRYGQHHHVLFFVVGWALN